MTGGGSIAGVVQSDSRGFESRHGAARCRVAQRREQRYALAGVTPRPAYRRTYPGSVYWPAGTWGGAPGRTYWPGIIPWAAATPCIQGAVGLGTGVGWVGTGPRPAMRELVDSTCPGAFM